MKREEIVWCRSDLDDVLVGSFDGAYSVVEVEVCVFRLSDRDEIYVKIWGEESVGNVEGDGRLFVVEGV